MDEDERMRVDISMLTRRVDDHALRLGVLEVNHKHVDEKFDSLRELIDEKFSGMHRSIDGWNKIGFWILTAVGGPLIVSVIGAAAWFLVIGGHR